MMISNMSNQTMAPNIDACITIETDQWLDASPDIKSITLDAPDLDAHLENEAKILVDGMVRESEIILSGHRRDVNVNFLVYNAEGQMSDRTRFPTVVSL